MRVVSWNVNGLRACAGRGFSKFLGAARAQIVGVQEVRALPEQLPDAVRNPPRWHTHFACAAKLGYSGVGLFSRAHASAVETSLGEPRFDTEGRLQIAHFGELVVANAYFPKGSGTNRDNSRVPYKLDFYRALFERLEPLRRAQPVLVIGDFNTAHTELDLARPRDNHKNSGFLPSERQELDRWLSAGWTDTFRALHPGELGHYTWWRQWGDARAKNVGWRIDYVLASPAAMKRVARAFIWPQIIGSDHCPVGVDLDTSGL
jgi:exodeoxyribonuclease III